MVTRRHSMGADFKDQKPLACGLEMILSAETLNLSPTLASDKGKVSEAFPEH
jgi:hypothetical protein